MTVPLLPYIPPDGTETLIAWLTPLGETRDERPSGAVLPFFKVHRIGGGDDGLVDRGLYSVSTFNSDSTSAQSQAWIAHRRMLLLAPNRYGYVAQQHITLTSGDVVQCDGVKTIEAPKEIDYGAGAGHQASAPYSEFVGTYEVALRFVLAPT